jgi:ATP-dependent helicase/nuclease subunit A
MPALTSNSGSLYSGVHWVTGSASGWEDEEEALDAYQAAVESLIEALGHHEEALRACPNRRDWNAARYVIALARVTRAVGRRYDERKADRGVVDFDDLIEGVLRLLEEHPEVGGRLRERFEHVMVDEAQDTDPRQWRLVETLSSDADAYDRGNVFAVGDRKQSIYRFRGADVATFVHVAERIEGANPEGPGPVEGDLEAGLRRNFRSVEGVLEPLNALFDATFLEPPAPAYEARPQPLEADREDPEGVCRGLEYVLVPTNDELRRGRLGPGHPLGTEAAENLSASEIEATAVAATIEDLLAAGTEVYPEDGDEGGDGEAQPATYEDITILIRDRTWLADYERALREYDIPYTVSSGIGFYETTEVTALVNLLRVLVDPEDDVALYGLLRSPMFGFEDRRLAPLASGGGIWLAMDEAEDELAAVRAAIEGWRRRAGLAEGAVTVDSWGGFIADAVSETGFDVSMAGGPRGNQALANIEKFRDIVRSVTGDGRHGLPSILQRIEARRDQEAREAQADELGHDDRVELTTVHSAKGEEFPVVIVPGIGRDFRDRAAIAGGKVEFERVGAEREPMLGLKAPDPEATHRLAGTAARRVVGDRRSAEERAEEKRTLYVACTRSRDQLVLVGHHESANLDDGVAGIRDADPAEAGSWRDWVQDALLTPDLLAELNRRNGVTWDCSHLGSRYADVEYRVRLPPAIFPEDRDVASVELPALGIEDLPADETRRFRLKPSSVPELLDEPYGEARVAADGRTVVYESDDVGDDGPLPAVGAGDAGDDGQLPANVFGDIVHKLAELRPGDDEDWRAIARQRLIAEPDGIELTDAEMERIRTHGARAIDFVEAYEAGLEIELVYEELTVTCEFDDGELTGDIDHLVVTPEAFHVVDYKTGAVTPETVEEKAAHLQKQLAVYAIALHQSDPERAVHTTLCFTGLEDEDRRGQTTRYSPAGLEELSGSYRRELWAALDGLVTG